MSELFEGVEYYRGLDTEQQEANRADIGLAITRCFYFISDLTMAAYWLEKSIKKAVEKKEMKADFWYWSAQINHKLEQHQEGFESIKHYIKIGGRQPKVWLDLVEMAISSGNAKDLTKLIAETEWIKISQQEASEIVDLLFQIDEKLIGLFMDKCVFNKELYHPVLLVHRCARLIPKKKKEALKDLTKIIDCGDEAKQYLNDKYPSLCQVEWVQKILIQNS